MSDDDVIKVPTVATVKVNTSDGVPWARMYSVCLVRERALIAECDRLREALERLTSACERNHRVAHMGRVCDKYEFAVEPKHNPVKSARAALQEAGDD
jgi:hypothetical protein